jgi:hypothetical protein
MRTRDEQVKRQQDETTKVRNDFNAVSKKEGGNLMTRDFTDDIYEKAGNEWMYVPESSDMFVNLLVVVPNVKMQEFRANYWNIAPHFYEQADATEEPKLPEQAAHRFKALKEAAGEHWLELVEKIKGSKTAVFTEADEKNAIAFLLNQAKTEFAKKKAARFPYPVIPDCFTVIPNLDDKDKDNTVVRLVAYKSQADEINKILRKSGYASRVFHFNPEKWNEDKKQRLILKETLAQKTSKLHQTAVECFQELFIALMHLKIIRVYIDSVLRFGIPPTFYTGLVMPKKGDERKILTMMSDHLADAEFREFYGEKMDASEADDYWPFVSVPLTSPNFLHTNQA